MAALGASLVVAAFLTDFDAPPYPWDRDPYVADGVAAWCVAFVVMPFVVAAIAHARSPLAGSDYATGEIVGLVCVAVSVLLLLPVARGTVEFLNHDLSDINGGFIYELPIGPAIGLSVVGITTSRLVSAPRLLALYLASTAGAFTLSHVWERTIFDGLNIAVVILASIAVVMAATLVTVLIPDDRPRREATIDESATLGFLESLEHDPQPPAAVPRDQPILPPEPPNR